MLVGWLLLQATGLLPHSVHGQQLYANGDYQLCQLQLHDHSVLLNAVAFKHAEAACDSFDMDLLRVAHLEEHMLSGVGSMLLECAKLGGVQVSAGWLSSESASHDCFAVDVAGTLISGSKRSCQRDDSHLFPICKRRHDGPVKGQLLPLTIPSLSSIPSLSLTIPSLPLSIPSLSSVPTLSLSAPSLPLSVPGLSLSIPSLPVVPTLPVLSDLPISLPISLPSSIPISLPSSIPSSLPATLLPTVTTAPNSTSIPPPVCPVSILGFKLITTPLSYREAECACKALGMTVAESNFVSFWPAAFLAHTCVGNALAWLKTTGDAATRNLSCLAMKATQLGLAGPSLVAMSCELRRPVVCMGPMATSWDDLEPLLAIVGVDKQNALLGALKTMYPLFSLPSLSDLAKMASLKSGGECQGAGYQVVSVKVGETVEQTCLRVHMTLAEVGDANRELVERIIQACPRGGDGVRVAAQNGSACTFMDKVGSVFMAMTPLANALYTQCRQPTAALCKA